MILLHKEIGESHVISVERSIFSEEINLKDLLELTAFFIIYLAVPWPTWGHRQPELAILTQY